LLELLLEEPHQAVALVVEEVLEAEELLEIVKA